MHATSTIPVVTPAHTGTVSRRTRLLSLTGLDVLGQYLGHERIEYDVELDPRDVDLAVTIYRADDTVLVVRGYGIDRYDVARYDLPAWQDVHGKPTHAANGLNRWEVGFIAQELADLPAVA
jgi:hypothetical protein